MQCQRCGLAARFVQQQNQWWCDSCRGYVQVAQPAQPASAQPGGHGAPQPGGYGGHQGGGGYPPAYQQAGAPQYPPPHVAGGSAPGGKSRKGLVIGLIAVLAIGGGVAAIALSSGDGDKDDEPVATPAHDTPTGDDTTSGDTSGASGEGAGSAAGFGANTGSDGDTARLAQLDPTKLVSGGKIRPYISKGAVNFALPKSGQWWVEVNMVCYAAIVNNPLAGGAAGGAFDMLYTKYPGLREALVSAGINLERDLYSAGAFDCGDEPCMFVAAKLDNPDKLGKLYGDMLNTSDTPAPPPTLEGDLHWKTTLDVDGGKRDVHLLLLPIDWSGAGNATSDWQTKAKAATHLVFLYGATRPATVVDPLDQLADVGTAKQHVDFVEELVFDSTDRCFAMRFVDEMEPFPGLQIVGARAVAGAPPIPADDRVAREMGFSTSPIIEVALEMKTPPTQAQADEWVAMGKGVINQQLGPMLPMLAAQGGAEGQMLIDVVAAGFEYRVDGKELRLSLGTRNVSSAEVTAIESKYD